MLRPINLVCQPALDACHALQARLILWLSDAARVPGDVTDGNLKALHPNPIVGNWLVAFLNKKANKKRLRSYAEQIAGLAPADKTKITAWLNATNNVAAQFHNPCPAWLSKPSCSKTGWTALSALMVQFYEKGLGGGIPFNAAGNPVAIGGVNRKTFVTAFKQAHGDRACILCDGALGTPEVDHWIAKKHYPGLSTASHNLIPICHECNSRANKGEKPVWENAVNAFENWFHPVFRSAHGCMEPRHQTLKGIKVMPIVPAHTQRVQKLDGLINLSGRWSAEFKAQSRSFKNTLRGKLNRQSMHATTAAIAAELQELKAGIATESPPEASSIIRNLTLSVLQEPARLDALLVELTT